MTTIDLSKSQFFLRDLAKVQFELNRLNAVDTSIKKINGAITSFIMTPIVSSEEVKSVLSIANEISKSYNKETVELTALIERLLEECDFLEVSQSVSKNAKLFSKIEHFYKMAK